MVNKLKNLHAKVVENYQKALQAKQNALTDHMWPRVWDRCSTTTYPSF